MAENYREVQKRLAKVARPESLALSYGYSPHLSEGALIPPIFLSSTFVFSSAEEGARSFELAYQLREPGADEAEMSLIYSRVNNPNLQILEERLTLFEKGAELACVFSSGMAAISTTILSLVGPGQAIIYTNPVYGGTHYLFVHILPRFGIATYPVRAGSSKEVFESVFRTAIADGKKPRLFYIETPANPTLCLTDMGMCAELAKELSAELQLDDEKRVLVAVDNTFMGPIWQHPLEHGADIVLYSATKFIGGHSDLVGGVALSNQGFIRHHISVYRTILGTMMGPFGASQFTRSLDTLKLRMTAQRKNARDIAIWLNDHPSIDEVIYPGLLDPESDQGRIYTKQCSHPGAILTFEVGTRERAFKVLDSFELIKLAVSLGGTHSLVEHPSSMTHADVPLKEQAEYGLTPGMIRLSVGVEHPDDLIRDLKQALSVLG